MEEQSKPRLLILYGSQTGNAQDVAERVTREARLMLYAPSIMPMDAYPLQQLPEERYVVFVTSTTGQGDPPDNMLKFWKLLLRKNLPPSILSGVSYAVFGLGDSGYVKYNVAAIKLDRRMAALGAVPLVERGLGDEQHSSGYEASLDPWLQQLWVALRLKCPLPPGVTQPAMDEASLLQLGPPKYKVAYLTAPEQHHNITKQQQYQQQLAAAPDPAAADHIREQQLVEDAAAAAVAFRAVAAEAAGMSSSSGSTAAAVALGASPQHTSPFYGPWRPFMAPLVVNQRVTAADHFQDTRHIEFDLQGSGLSYEPGDLLCIFPRTPAADVETALSLLGLDGDSWVRVEAAEQPIHQHEQQQGATNTHHAVCEAPVRAVLQGVVDLSGSSPRRYLFQVLSHFTDNLLHKDRLQYFATAEGRDDLYRYNQRERRSLLEVLQDFASAQPPLEWLLAAAPILGPRQFSLASAQSAYGDRAAILMAVVSWNTPTKRPRKGLLSHWLAGLKPGRQGSRAEAAGPPGNCSAKDAQRQQQLSNGLQECSALQDSQDLNRQDSSIRVPVWVEKGALRLPPADSTPLLMVGPGTGVAPFRSFCWHRAAVRQLQKQQQQQVDGQSVSVASSSMLFFGCRTPAADFYYEHEWLPLMQQGALHEQHGLVVAFSRHQPQPDQQQLLEMLQRSQELHRQGHADMQAVLHVNGLTAPAPSSGKVYVTHKLHQHGAEVWQLLSEQGAWVYVSGSAEKMPANVVSAFEDIAMVQASRVVSCWPSQLRRVVMAAGPPATQQEQLLPQAKRQRVAACCIASVSTSTAPPKQASRGKQQQQKVAAAAAAGADGPWLIVGLGNPGPRYEKTRHNVGFMVVDTLARSAGIDMRKLEKSAAVGRGELHGRKVILAKPVTFMNNSGESVAALARYYKVPPQRVLVVADDLDQPQVGTVKFKQRGGHGGHNGLRSIIQHLGGSQDFPRIKIGIGRPSGQMDVASYVLQEFRRAEMEAVDGAIAECMAIIDSCLALGLDKALSGSRL